jgi:hypothetical protein
MIKYILLLISIAFSGEANSLFVSYGFTGPIFQNLKLISTNSRIDSKNPRTYQNQHYKNDKYKVLVETLGPVDSTTAASLIKIYGLGLIGTYQNRKSPYTGESATSIPCSKKSAPQIYTVSYFNSAASVIVVNSTERDTLGICQESLIKQKVIIFLGYSPTKKSFIQLRVYMPIDHYTEKIKNDFLNQFVGRFSL